MSPALTRQLSGDEDLGHGAGMRVDELDGTVDVASSVETGMK
jgi:hypothetical protein